MVGKRRQGLLQLFATDDPAAAEASIDSLFTEYPSLDLSPTFVPKRPTTVSGRASASCGRHTQTAAVEHQDDRTEYADCDDARAR
jgi:plasmid stabilization system protein ParE